MAHRDAGDVNRVPLLVGIEDAADFPADRETEFRTKPVLQKYLPSIDGITDLSAASEDSAIAGKFVAAKDPLRDISKKLADTLAVLPR